MPLGPGHNEIMKTYGLLSLGNVHMHFTDVSFIEIPSRMNSTTSLTVPVEGDSKILGGDTKDILLWQHQYSRVKSTLNRSWILEEIPRWGLGLCL